MGQQGGWRGATALAVLVLLGVAGGYGASRASAPEPARAGVAEPVAAQGPRPGEPEEPAPPEDPDVPDGVVKDPGDPALRPDVPLEVVTMGSGRSAISFPVPAGWTRNQNAANEAKWKKPDTSNNTYVLRVEQITSQDLTVAEAIRQRVRELMLEQPKLRIRERGPRSLEYTYISDEGTFRHSFMRWIDLSGNGEADVEVVVHGRERDVAGTSDLIERIAAGMTPGAAP